MNQIQLWLAPLLIGSIFGVTACLRVPLHWSAGYLGQHFLIAIAAICGFIMEPAWLFAVVGWFLFFTFNVGRRILVSSIGNHLAALRTTAALKQAKLLSFLAWGSPGRFWIDLVHMLDFYSKNQNAQAEALADKWYEFDLPPQMRDTLTAYLLTGIVMNRDWPLVLETFERAVRAHEKDLQDKRKGARYPAQAAISAMRAYCELGMFDKAIDCLERAEIASNFHQKESLDTIFVSLFSLSGATQDLEELLKSLPPAQGGIPEYGRHFWRGRCAATNGDVETALREYDKCLSLLPKNDENWRDRVTYQRNRVETSRRRRDGLPPELDEAAACLDRLAEVTVPVLPLITARACDDVLRRARVVRDHAMTVATIMDSGKRGPAVRRLVAVLAIIFAFGLTGQVSDNAWITEIYFKLFSGGLLQGDLVLKGEWWRVLTFNFLHANLSHLFMNLFGLIWLGKHVENVYGSTRFLIIFFGSGILSGVAQMLLTPQEAAVGASGAVMGVFGASAAATLRLKHILPAKVRTAELKWMAGLAVMQIAFDQIVNLASSLGHEEAVRIAAWAHAGGILAGFILGYLLPMQPFEPKKEFTPAAP